ncbi:MAG: hypothetical protein R3B99_29250 [Polyangiales bacterium]
MKSRAPLDPSLYEAGPATDAVRRLLTAYVAIDWYAPASLSEADAHALFLRYHTLARAFAPDLFGPRLEIEHATGGLREFSTWVDVVRNHAPRGWDWKYAVLKPLTQRHSDAHGWSRPLEGPLVGPPGARDCLFTVFPAVDGSVGVWNVPLPRVDWPAEALRFFKGYCDLDLFEALEWQLAEPGCPLSDNPFVPLLELYAAGYSPFHLTAHGVVLFRALAPLT